MVRLISVSVVVAWGSFLAGAYMANNYYDDRAKKYDCEKALVLRAHDCKHYYLTKEEIKLIDRLGE